MANLANLYMMRLTDVFQPIAKIMLEVFWAHGSHVLSHCSVELDSSNMVPMLSSTAAYKISKTSPFSSILVLRVYCQRTTSK